MKDIKFEDAAKEDKSDIDWSGKRIKINGKLIPVTYIKGQKGMILLLFKKPSDKMHIYNSWGIPVGLLREAMDVGTTSIRYIIGNSKKVLIVSPINFKNKGFYHRSRGYEPQWHLRENDFDRVIK